MRCDENNRRAIVESLASHGAAVHICARTGADVEEAVRGWKSRGLEVTGSECDVSCPKSRAALVSEASRVFGDKLDILVSNVGFNIRKPTVDFTPDEYRRLMDTNLEATFAVGRCYTMSSSFAFDPSNVSPRPRADRTIVTPTRQAYP